MMITIQNNIIYSTNRTYGIIMTGRRARFIIYNIYNITTISRIDIIYCDFTAAASACCTVAVVHYAHYTLHMHNNNNNMIYFIVGLYMRQQIYNAVDCAIINQREIGKSVDARTGNEYDVYLILLYGCCCGII